MIRGNIDVTWSVEDYTNLEWYKNTNPLEKFDADGISTNLYKDIDTYICNSNIPNVFYKVADQFNLKNCVIAINKMVPGQILPYHSDKYLAYISRNNISLNSSITRIIVFLHDQKLGHQLWIDNDICLGKAGSYYGWRNNTKHMSANLGSENRYILQITGVCDA
jgi:hypothetical protein